MWLWAVWTVCLVVVIVLALVGAPIWVSAAVMLVWLYYYVRWMIQFIQTILLDLT